MRAPPSARIDAVAAPSPDAEPVTIAFKASFDIASSFCLKPPRRRTLRLAYRAEKPAQISLELHCAELGIPQAAVARLICPHRRSPCGERLSGPWLFPIIPCKNKVHAKAPDGFTQVPII